MANTYDSMKKQLQDEAYRKMLNEFMNSGAMANSSLAQQIWAQQSPAAAYTVHGYGQRKAQGGGVTQQEIETLTSPSFYTPESYGEFNKGNVRQAIIDQTAFINMHRNEGVWDVETNDPSWWSDAYLAQTLGGLGERINASKLKDAENRAAWEQDGVQRNWLRSQYQQLMNGKDTADPIEQLQNWTYFDWLQGDRSSAYDYGSVMSGYNQMDDDAYYAEIDRIKNQFEGADWESLTTYEPSDYKSETEYLTYLQELVQKEQANRQTAAEYQAKLADPQYRNTMAMATESGQVEVGGKTYPNLWLWATETGNTELLNQYEEMGYGFLLPEELLMYQQLYEINPADAMGYLKSRSRELNVRRKAFRDAEKSLKATDGFWNGVISWAESRATPIENILSGDILRQTYHAWKGDADPNAYYFDAQNDQYAIDTAQHNEVEARFGSTAAFFFDAFNNVVDVAVPVALGAAVGAPGAVNMGINVTKAYSGSLQSSAARDIQGLWSVGQALGDAGIEVLFEKLGFDGSTKSADKIWNFLRNAFGEGAEEVFTNMGTTAFDAVMSAAQGRDNTLVEMYKAYTLAGAENPGMQVALDKAAELGMDFVMGAIPGGTLGGVQSAADAISTRNLGKSIAPTVNEDALLEIARAMPEGSESRRLANKYFPQALTGDVATEETTESKEPAGKSKKPGKLETPVELTGEAAPDAEPAAAKSKKPGKLETPVELTGEAVPAAETKGEKAESKAKKPGKIEKPVELTGEVAPEPETAEAKAKTKKPSLEGEEVALDGEAVPSEEPAAKKAEKPGKLEKPVELTGEAVPDVETAESTRTKEEKKAEKPAAPKKGKLSFYQLGRLTQALEVDLQEEHSRITNDVMDSAIANRLMELGDDAKTARANAPIIRKVYRGQEVALTERAGIAWNKNASQVARELASTLQEDAKAKAEQNAKGVVGDRATASDEARVGNSWRAAMGTVAEKATVQVRDMQTQLREALTNKKSVLNEAISTAKSKAAKVARGSKNVTSKMVTIYDSESGTESKGEFRRFKKHGGIMKMVVFSDGAEKTVSVEDIIEAEGSGMAEIIEYVADGGTHDMSEAEANTLAQVYQSVGGDADSVIRSYEMVYLSGYTGMEMPANVLPDAEAKAVYDSAKAEAVADEKTRVDRAKAVRRTTKGLVTFLGKVSKDSEVRGAGSEVALSEAMKGMTDSQQQMVEVVRAFAHKFQINMVLFESTDEGVSTMQNGSYDQNTHTVYIDINSGANSKEEVERHKKHGTLGYAMMRTLGHEVTHAIESTSAEGYAAYKAAVKEKLGKQWNSLVQEKLVNALNVGRKLTLQGAEAEVVADASEYMLQDSKFVGEIDKTVRGKVKAVIADFVQKVRSIFSTLTGGHRESAALRRMQGNVYHYLDNLQQLWDVAAEETIEARIEDGVTDALHETGEIYSYTVQNSARVIDKKTIEHLENQQHITTYRAMQVIDGELYPPMAEFIGSKKDGNREDSSAIGHWEMATEHPELIKWVDGKPKFELKKVNDDGSVSTVPAAYNPYMHSSNTVLNDQFSKAFQRKNLVVVECVVPVSESNGAYHAQYAKDATGWHEWKSGIVAGELAKQKNGFRRDVFLSRYIKPVRILSDAEVAKKIAGYLDGTDVTIPFQSAWPTLRDALVQEGVNVTAPRGLAPSQQKIAMEAFEEWKRTHGEQMEVDDETKQYSNRLLSNDEYKRVQSAWSDYIYRGYQFEKRLNGGIIVDLDNVIVYTDDEGSPQYVLEVGTDDRWSNNDVYNLVVEMEKDGVSHEVQQRVLESLFGKKGARFRTGGKRTGSGGQKRTGTGRNAGDLGERNRSEVSEEVAQRKQNSLRDDSGFASEAMETASKLENSSGDRLFSLRSMTEDYDTYRSMLDKAGVSSNEISDLFHVIDETMKIVAEHKDILDFGWNVGRNERSFSPVKPNSDSLYKVSLDFSSLCRKRLLQQAVQERLEAMYDTVLTKAERVAIRNALMELREQGKQIEVACALCYVESTRLKSPAQIQRFFDDRRAVMVDYFAKKNKAYMKQVNARANELIAKFGNEPGTKKKELNGFQKNAVTDLKRNMYKEYKPTAEEEAIIKTALELPGGSYRSASGLWSLKREHEVIFDAYTSYVRNATKSKGIEGDEAWWAGDSKKISNALIKKMNAENGLRAQSWSDFQVIHLLDYMAAIIELSTRNAKMQTYTKVPDFVKLMGDTGIMINLSLIPKGFDGTLNYDPIEGMPIDTALALREMFPNTAGTICIGITEEHIKMLLADSTIDYVIPYHASSLDKATRQQMGMKVWDDFTDYQNEKEVDYPEAVKGAKTYHKKTNFSDWFDYETVSKRATEVGAEQAMREAADRYVDLCHRRGLQEKFPQFATETNYWKLLIDRKMINQQTGEIIRQQAVKPRFDLDRIMEILHGEVERFNAQNKDFSEAVRHIDNMWADGDIRKAAKSKKVQDAVSAFDASVIVQNIVESAKELGTHVVQHSLRTEQTETPEFKRWFGNSKVVEADGNPKVMYHGTNTDKGFTVFNTFGSNFGLFGIGSYFTDDRDVAESYTRKGHGNNPRVYEVYLSIQNPLDMDAPFDPEVWNTDDEYINRLLADSVTNEDAFRKLKRYCADEDMVRSEAEEFITEYILDMGFDGIRHTGGGRYNKGDTNRHTVFIAFEPEQIKSATDNVGTFDRANPDILQSARDNAPGMTAREFLADADDSAATTVEERNALTIYQGLLKKHAEASEAVVASEKALQTAPEAGKADARKALTAARARQRDLYNRLINVERTAHVQNIIGRTNELIMEELSGKSAEAVSKAIAEREAKIAELKADLAGLKGAARTQREADIRENERVVRQLNSKAAQALLAANERYAQSLSNLRTRNELNLEIGKQARHIKRIVKRLNDRIIHEEDYKNVKEPLKPAVRTLVRTFIDGFGGMVFNQNTASHLRTVYDALARDGDDGAPDFYSDDVSNWLADLAMLAAEDAERRAAGGSGMQAVEQKLAIYTRVAEIADHIYKMVKGADELFVSGKRESFAAMSAEVGSGLLARDDKTLRVGATRDALRVLDDLLRTGNMTPTYFFDHLDNSGLSRLFGGMMEGQTQYAQQIREGQQFMEDAKRRYNFYAWQNMRTGVEFRTEQGHTIALTVPQMMWVYATAKREATNRLMDTHHLDQGGFRYAAKDVPRVSGKIGKGIPGSDKLHRLAAGDVQRITDALTAEQKACADELVGFLSTTCAEWGNAASMEMFGIRKYNEEYYFPFKTDSDQRYQRSDAGSTSTTNDARVKHSSFTHSLRKGANTPLVMGDFFEVIADHINQMATYSSFVVPIESMNRVLNAKVNDEADGSGSNVSIRSLVGRKYGEPAQKYMADLMKDMNGGPNTDNRGKTDALFRAFKRGAVMGSLSVALQQPTAIVRAFAYIHPRYFAHVTMEGNKRTWARMLAHSGTAVIKDMGKFDVGVGRTAKDWIENSGLQEFNVWRRGRFLLHTDGWNAVKNNWVEWATQLPGVMDRITWTHIWKAVEAEQADLHPDMNPNSDEFLDMVGRRFDDVINHTQVYDSILSKSQNMRSKNAFAQMSTAFMAEPTLNINMLYDALRGNHSAGRRAGIIASVIGSGILASAAASLIAAWNKDDDERKWGEQLVAEFASRAIDSVNPLTMIPYVSDLWSMVNGYDIERTDLSVLKDISDYTISFISKAADPEKSNSWRDYENLFGTIANLTGIPAKNISRDVRRVRNLIVSDKGASTSAELRYTVLEEITPLNLYDSSNKAYCQRLIAAVLDGDKQEAYDLWDYLTNSKKATQDSLNTNLRSELKRRVKEKSITPAEATKILRKYAPYKDDNDNTKKPQEWLNDKD